MKLTAEQLILTRCSFCGAHAIDTSKSGYLVCYNCKPIRDVAHDPHAAIVNERLAAYDNGEVVALPDSDVFERLKQKADDHIQKRNALSPAYKGFIPVFDVVGTPGFCIFCYAHKNDTKETSCNYGGRHEITLEDKPKEAPKKVVDKKLCLLCGKHKNNPIYATNGCEHKHEE